VRCGLCRADSETIVRSNVDIANAETVGLFCLTIKWEMIVRDVAAAAGVGRRIGVEMHEAAVATAMPT
jgi:hypothetical protein